MFLWAMSTSSAFEVDPAIPDYCATRLTFTPLAY